MLDCRPDQPLMPRCCARFTLLRTPLLGHSSSTRALQTALRGKQSPLPARTGLSMSQGCELGARRSGYKLPPGHSLPWARRPPLPYVRFAPSFLPLAPSQPLPETGHSATEFGKSGTGETWSMPDSIHFLDHAIAGAFVGNEEAGTSLIDRSPAPPFAQRVRLRSAGMQADACSVRRRANSREQR